MKASEYKPFKRVYVAGVYSYVPEGENAPVSVFKNMRVGIQAALRVWQLGFAPFCPWLDYLYSLMQPYYFDPQVEDYYGMSLAWLDASDYMVVLPYAVEHSVGVQLEIDYAIQKGIPVYTLAEFIENVNLGRISA